MADYSAIAARLGGRFVVLDGPDGVGKTTQTERLADELTRAGGKVVRVRDPGGTAVGEQVRRILLDNANDAMDVVCEMLMYQASRAQLVAEKIRPALAAGAIVLADRFFCSTCAYQGLGGGMDIEVILEATRIAVAGCWPSLTIVLDLSADEGLRRRLARQAADRMESKGIEFHRRVRQMFRMFATTPPTLPDGSALPGRFVLVDARGDVDAVAERIAVVLSELTN